MPLIQAVVAEVVFFLVVHSWAVLAEFVWVKCSRGRNQSVAGDQATKKPRSQLNVKKLSASFFLPIFFARLSLKVSAARWWDKQVLLFYIMTVFMHRSAMRETTDTQGFVSTNKKLKASSKLTITGLVTIIPLHSSAYFCHSSSSHWSMFAISSSGTNALLLRIKFNNTWCIDRTSLPPSAMHNR